MDDNKQHVAVRAPNEAARREREPELVLRPPVDIFEDADGVTLQLDVPGAAKDRLNVQADKTNLVIEANAQIDMPQGTEALYADVRSTLYRRNFTLSRELECERIEANLKDGVLTLRIPKRAELRPRKVEVRAG